MGHALAIAEVYAVIVRATDGLPRYERWPFRADWGAAAKGSIQRAVAALGTAGLRGVRDFLVDVYGLVLMEAENVSVLHLDHRVVIERPTVADVEFLGHGVAIVGIDQTANAADQAQWKAEEWSAMG